MVPLAYTATPIAAPAGIGMVIAFTDVRERREAERTARERDVAEARAAEARAAQRRTIEAADAARRQVTRDLHDGAQQQFVNVVINLQLAQQKWESETDRARELLDAAAEQAKTGIDELRELAAGIHPTLLTTRGLLAAVEALADRLPIPVEPLDIPNDRFPPAIEASVYFLVSEALTNVVKHAGAMSAGVRIAEAEGRLTVEVDDDGWAGPTCTHPDTAWPAWRIGWPPWTETSQCAASRPRGRLSARRSRCRSPTSALEVAVEGGAGQLGLGHEPHRPGAPDQASRGRTRVGGGQQHPRPAVRGDLRGD